MGDNKRTAYNKQKNDLWSISEAKETSARSYESGIWWYDNDTISCLSFEQRRVVCPW